MMLEILGTYFNPIESLNITFKDFIFVHKKHLIKNFQTFWQLYCYATWTFQISH